MTTILCIEDEATLRQDLSEELEDAGYKVKQACDGDEGLAMIIKHKPDLVLCDITMPTKNGYTLLSEVREKYPLLAEMPFIFISALAGREEILTGLKCGADTYLTKPIDFELLLTTIQTSLRQIDRIKHKQERFLVLDI
jgi:DNA-binding response OmpR family regulator